MQLRIGVGHVIAAVCAFGLIGAMFAPWYEASVSVAGFAERGDSAWGAFALRDLVLLASAVVVAAAVVAALAARLGARAAATLIGAAGAVAVAVCLWALVDAPADGPAAIRASTSVSRGPGLFVGLGCALGMAFGGFSAAGSDMHARHA